MQFVSGFLKHADLSRHSDGTEFKVTDNEPSPYSPGTGSMAPAGIAEHKEEKLKQESKPLTKKETGLRAALGKFAYVGGKSQAASTIATQLKYETTGDDSPENFGYNEDAREREKKKKKEDKK